MYASMLVGKMSCSSRGKVSALCKMDATRAWLQKKREDFSLPPLRKKHDSELHSFASHLPILVFGMRKEICCAILK